MSIDEAIKLLEIEKMCVKHADVCNRECDECALVQNTDKLLEMYTSVCELLKQLKEYQQLEEQNRLVKLPCKIGDDVWFVPSQTNYKLNILNHHREENKICHQKVARITFSRNGWYLECDKDLEYAIDHILIDKMYKETWFLTKSEAEAKLKELRGNQNGKV